MYEHPQIFGARKYFLTDGEMHDLCIGELIPDYGSDSSTDEETEPEPQKTYVSAGTQTEPWSGSEDARQPAAPRLVRVLPGTTTPSPELCAELVH